MSRNLDAVESDLDEYTSEELIEVLKRRAAKGDTVAKELFLDDERLG